MKIARSIILGSSSSSRQAILTELGLDFRIVKPNINEKEIGNRSPNSSPSELVLNISRAKSHHLLSQNSQSLESLSSPHSSSSATPFISPFSTQSPEILITADTVVVWNDQILEKPTDDKEFIQNMKHYSNSYCSVVTGIVVTDLMNGKQLEGVDIARVYFSTIDDSTITNLLLEGKIFHCAGGLMVENPLMAGSISHIDGSEDTVKGLSKTLLLSLLDQLIKDENCTSPSHRIEASHEDNN